MENGAGGGGEHDTLTSWFGAAADFYGQKDTINAMIAAEVEVILGEIRQKHGTLKAWAATCPGKLYLSGHSMGAAMAQVIGYLANLNSDPLGMKKPIAAMYLLGPPGVATKALHNGQSSDGCFDGFIYYATVPEGFLPGYGAIADKAVSLLTGYGFRHAKMAWTGLNVKAGDSSKESNLLGIGDEAACTTDLPAVYQGMLSNSTLMDKAVAHYLRLGGDTIGLHDNEPYVYNLPAPMTPRVAAAAAACNYRNSALGALLKPIVDPMCAEVTAVGWTLAEEYKAHDPNLADKDNADLYRSGGDCLLAMCTPLPAPTC